ncbi:hypothetical protein Patl1_26213 [Pistacia atlantica]|uniref:Uncharacterized protein n=1 Tax=Pistacia atlantica TaxID=434234 RepID=A0ACC1B352_9ROSI|nr:hypothetical protein Patl1_26213 [Pistacia atlantica]
MWGKLCREVKLELKLRLCNYALPLRYNETLFCLPVLCIDETHFLRVRLGIRLILTSSDVQIVKTKKGVKHKSGLIRKGLRKEVKLWVSSGSKKDGAGGKISSNFDEIEALRMMNSLSVGKIEINLTNGQSKTSHLNLESVESLYGRDASNRAQVLQLARNSSCVEEGSMVTSAGRTCKLVAVPFSLTLLCPSNGTVHSIVAGFERGQPLIVDDGRVPAAVAGEAMVIGTGVTTICPPVLVAIEGSRQWANCLVGLFIDKKLPFHIVQSYAMKLWMKYEITKVMMNDKAFFFLKFGTEFEMIQCLEDGPWLFQNRPILLQKWQPAMELSKEAPRLYSEWGGQVSSNG